jgi:tetratricopeptide (TPR) repeat protein
MGAITTTGDGRLIFNWWAKLLGLFGWTDLGRVAKSDRLINQARAQETFNPRRAIDLYTNAIDLLSATSGFDRERQVLLGGALLSLGRLREAAGQASLALDSYLRAKQILPALPQAALSFIATTLAARGDTKAQAIAIYLELIATVKNQSAAQAAARSVYELLEKCCAVEETSGATQAMERLALCQRVIATDANLEWAHYYAGVAQFAQRRYDLALPCFERAASLHSRRNLLGFYCAFSKGMCTIQSGEAEQSVVAFRQASQAAPERADAQFALGKTLVQLCQGKGGQTADRARLIAEAASCLERATRLEPRQAEYADYLGQAWVLADDHARAAWAFERATQIEPNRSNYFLHLALSLKPLGSTDAAKAAALSAIALDQQCMPAHKLLGEIYLEAKDYSSAAREFQMFLAFDSNDIEARKKLGFAFYCLQKFDEAIRTLEPAHSRSSTATFYLARCHAKLDQMEKAIEYLQRLAGHPQFRLQAFYYLALSYAHMGEFAKAIAAFGSAIRECGDDARIYLQRGHAYVKTERFAEARADYEKARALQPGNSEILLHLGNVCRAVGDEQAAASYFLQALKLDGKDVAMWLALGALYEKGQQMQEALKAYLSAEMIDPLNARIHRRLGVLQCRQQDYASALKSLDQAAALGDVSDELFYYRGLVAACCGELTVTFASWEALLKRHPEDQRLALNMNRLHYQIGEQHIKAERWREGIAEWMAYLNSRPEDEDLKKEIAKLHLRVALSELANDEIAAARSSLEQSLALDSENILCRYYFALCGLAEGQWDNYIAEAESLMGSLHPQLQCHARYNLAIARLAKGEPEKAEVLLTEILAEEVWRRFDVSLPLAIVHAQAGQWTEAVKWLTSGMETVV